MSCKLSASGDELRTQFFDLYTREDIAKLLDVEPKRLIYHLYISNYDQRYITFQIPKRSGGLREITAPATALKCIQQKLNQVLQYVYQPRASVHGFIHKRSIVTNADRHKRQRYVLNIDLMDFFPSITYRRVRGLFMAIPYELPQEVASVLARICCFKNQLPQGAPTSPIVANMICAKMDSRLLRLAQQHRCIYTRYADDITFSTNLKQFPIALARVSEITGQLEIGDELSAAILENGFEINPAKLRLQGRDRRQEVTGLTTNIFPNVERRYVRQIRAMLHAWEKYGLEAAEREFLNCYDRKHRNPDREVPIAFKHVVKGKIEFLGMVRGKRNPIYLNFVSKLGALDPQLIRTPSSKATKEIVHSPVLVITEGKTDWKHMKAALRDLRARGEFQSLSIRLYAK